MEENFNLGLKISKMQIKFFLSIFFLFSVQVLIAQGFQGKIITGFNASQIDGDRIWGYNKFGFLLGAAACIQLSKKTSIQQEICYSGKGAASTAKQQFLTSRMHYVDFPLIVNIKLKGRWILQPGITPSYLLSAKMDDLGYGYIDITKYLKKYDICFSFGLEYALDQQWALNMRFNYSALPINIIGSGYNSNAIYYGGWFNNLFNFSLRYIFINPASYRAKDEVVSP